MKSSDAILKEENFSVSQDTIDGIPCTIGYMKEFRWSWLGSQLNTFIIIGETKEKIDKRFIESFSKKCFQYSIKNNKGWPRGLQSAVASIAILQGSIIDDEAIAFCKKLSKIHWSAFEIPVLYNTDTQRRIRYTIEPIWGSIFFSFLSRVIDRITNRLQEHKE